MASPSESSHACGSTSVAFASTGCAANPRRSTAPVSVSQTTMCVKAEELSKPATIPMPKILPHRRPLSVPVERQHRGRCPYVLLVPQSSSPFRPRSRSERTRSATPAGTFSPTLSLTTWYAL